MPSFKFIRSETVLEGRAFKVRRDHVVTPDGRRTNYEIIEHVGSVVMLPIDALGNLIFVRQYRQAAGREMLELPAGTRDGDETYETCAAREMREETGMAAAKLEKVGEFFLAPGYSTEFMVAFLATELTPSPLPADVDEFLRVDRIPVKKARQLVEAGELQDAKSLAALYIAGPRLHEYI